MIIEGYTHTLGICTRTNFSLFELSPFKGVKFVFRLCRKLPDPGPRIHYTGLFIRRTSMLHRRPTDRELLYLCKRFSKSVLRGGLSHYDGDYRCSTSIGNLKVSL